MESWATERELSVASAAVSSPPNASRPVVLLMAMIPCLGCLPALNQAMSESGSSLSRARTGAGKFVSDILASSGHADEAMNTEPFMG